MTNILVTGGAGYIGSHTLIELINNDFRPVVVDNLSNSSIEALQRVKVIVGETTGQNIDIPFYEGDVGDPLLLKRIFSEHSIDSVIHFAGLKAVGESTEKPVHYYQNNVAGTLVLLAAMAEAKVHNIVFSSSATVYGVPLELPILEHSPAGATTNPYGRSKYIVECMLNDLFTSNQQWNIAVLRYFNPVGAHESGCIGEDPTDIPNNLMPFITQVAVGKRDKLSVFGSDYETADGTGVRDYIHVVDLALGHVKALEKFSVSPGYFVVNLGTGVGYSVLDMVRAFEEATGQSVPYELVDRRPDDIAACFASTTKAKEFIDWQAERGLKEMMADSWRWQSNNPEGY